MRRALLLVVVVTLAGVIYAFFPRSRHDRPASPSEPAASDQQTMTNPSPPRLAIAPTGPDAGVATRVPVTGEAVLMQRLRDSVRANPQLAETLAREGRGRFPDSPDSDERDALLVDALINQQRIGAARSETYYYLDHHPNGRYREHLFVMTGVHPTPKGPGATR